jgi:hypothetical protein
MSLFENPFYILGVSTRDPSQKIVATAERNLTLDADLCTKARSTLTNPRTRLSAEIAWLPGMAPIRASELISKIKSEPNEVAKVVSGLDPLSKCNLSAALLPRWDFRNHASALESWLVFMAEAFESIVPLNVLAQLNEDRAVARIPEIQNVEDVEEALKTHQKYLIDTIRQALETVPDPDIVVANVLRKLLEKHGQIPTLMDEFVETYQIEVQKYLYQLQEQIGNSLNGIRHSVRSSRGGNSGLDSQITTLEQLLKSWDQIAEPIHIKMRCRGGEDKLSLSILNEVRALTLFLANEHGLHEESKRISEVMSEVFEELPQVTDRLANDISVLDEIISKKGKAKAEYDQWKRDISLDLRIGKLLKNRLVISPEGVFYNSIKMPLEEIPRVRWGVLAHYVNGIPTGKNYTVWIGTNTELCKIECSESLELSGTSRQRFETITDKLWKAVGVRLFGEMLQLLSKTDGIRIGEIFVDKNGILLKKRKFLGSEPFYARWEELTIGNGQGSFVISAATEKKATASLSYRDSDNVHILEAVMRFLWKDGNYLKLRRGEFA